MLLKVLEIVEAADGPITLSDLGRRLNIDPGPLEAMLAHWATKGRLVVDGRSSADCATAACSCGGCAGATGCPFIVRLPRTFSVAQPAGEPRLDAA